MTDEATGRVARLLSRPLTDFVEKTSVALLIRWPKASNPELASGTCLKISGRYFIATVAHALRNVPESAIDLVCTHGGTHSHTPIARTGMLGGGDDDPLDVGYLELAEEHAIGLGKEFLSLASLAPYSVPPIGEWVFAYGYPREEVPQNLAKQGKFPISGMGMFTEPLPVGSWPSKARATTDIAYHFLEVAHYGAEDFAINVPGCVGMSGGSLWRFNPNTPGILGTHSARWVAIQRAWVGNSRRAYGNQVQALLRLIAMHYPTLMPRIGAYLLACRFARLVDHLRPTASRARRGI